MIELEPQAFKQVLPLYFSQKKRVFPLILAVIQNKQEGRVFVDNISSPSFAMVVHKFGFMQIFGVDGTGRFDADLIDFFSVKHDDVPSYLLWYSPPHRWQLKLDRLKNGQIRRRERARFVFGKQSDDYLQGISEKYDVQLLDKDLLEKTDSLNLDIPSRFWSSADDFLKYGVGVCLLEDNEMASLCYSACVAGGLAEIDIMTLEKYRGQGFAMIVAQKYIQECFRRGIEPTWDCFIKNTASMKLARGLGFSPLLNYFLYSFNLPINFV